MIKSRIGRVVSFLNFPYFPRPSPLIVNRQSIRTSTVQYDQAAGICTWRNADRAPCHGFARSASAHYGPLLATLRRAPVDLRTRITIEEDARP